MRRGFGSLGGTTVRRSLWRCKLAFVWLSIGCDRHLRASILILTVLSRSLLLNLVCDLNIQLNLWPLLPPPPGTTWSTLMRTLSLAQIWCKAAQTTPKDWRIEGGKSLQGILPRTTPVSL